MSSIIDEVFDAKIARRGGMVRRNAQFLERVGCREPLINEASARGWHVYEIGDQIVVFCTQEPHIKRIWPPSR